MDNIIKNISSIKNILKKKSKYNYFSANGLITVGILFILYFLYAQNLFSFIGLESYLVLDETSYLKGREVIFVFLSIAIISVILMTILSARKSYLNGDKLFTKNIRYIIVNMGLLLIPYIFVVNGTLPHSYSNITVGFESYMIIIILSFFFYGLLILFSRLYLPKVIVIFGWINLFIALSLVTFLYLDIYLLEKELVLANIINYLILFSFGHGHIIIGLLLKKKNG